MQTVRLRHFLLDCRSRAGDPQERQAWSEQERQAAHRYLEETYEDILHNFDPKVVRLRQRRKIILADRAVKDLL